MQREINKNLVALRSNTIAYPAGHHIVLYNRRTNSQTFLSKSMRDGAVIAFNVINKSLYCLFAFALETQPSFQPTVKIYQNSRLFLGELKHVHVTSDYTIKELAFSTSEKLIFTYAESSKDNEHILTVWSVETRRPLSQLTVDRRVTQMESYNYSKSAVVYLMSGALMTLKYKRKLQKLIEKPLETSQKVERQLESAAAPTPVPVTCYHINHKTDLLFKAGPAAIDIFIKTAFLQSVPVANYLLRAEGQSSETPCREPVITAVSSINNLLIVGMSDFSRLLVFSLGADNAFRFRNFIDLPIKGVFVRVLKIDVAEDLSVIGVSVLRQNTIDSSLWNESCPTVEFFELDCAILEAINYSSTEAVRPLYANGTFSESILDAGIAQNSDVVVCLGSDRLVKLFNYRNEEEELASLTLLRDGLCIDIHPTGLQIAVGFKEGLKIFYATIGEMRETVEKVGKECSCVRYSSRGDMLAASSGGSVVIYDPFSMEQIASLVAHATSIRGMFWRGNDNRLVTSCANGNIFVWQTKSWEKDFEFYPSNKSAAVLAVDYDPVLDLIVFSTAGSKLHMFYDKGSIEIVNNDITPAVVTCLLICRELKALFAGCSNGAVQMYIWPLCANKGIVESITTLLHQAPITRIMVNAEQSAIVTCAEDATVFTSRAYRFSDNFSEEPAEEETAKAVIRETLAPTTEEPQEDAAVLIYDAAEGDELEEMERDELRVLKFGELTITSQYADKRKQEVLKDLDFQIQNLKNEIDEQKELLDRDHKKIKKQTECERKEVLKQQKELLASAIENEERKHQELLEQKRREIETFQAREEELQHFHETQLLAVYREHDGLNARHFEMIEELHARSVELNAGHQTRLAEAARLAEERSTDLRTRYQRAFETLCQNEEKFVEVLSQMEDEFRESFTSNQKTLDTALVAEKRKIDELKMMNSRLQKEHQKHRERQGQLDSLVQDSRAQNDQLKEEIQTLVANVERMQGKLGQQEAIINAKENSLKQFRHQNEYLQSKKGVYDYLVVSLEVQQNQLVDYLNYLNNNLKKIHSGLIVEAETSKNLKTEKEATHKLLIVKRAKVEESRNDYRHAYQQTQRVVHEVLAVVLDECLSGGEIQERIVSLLNGSQVQAILRRQRSPDGDAEPKGKPVAQKPYKVFKIETRLPNSVDTATRRHFYPLRSIQPQEQGFMKELNRMRTNFSDKYRESELKYATMTADKQRVVHAIQDVGAQLIQQSNQLRLRRYLIFQDLYEQKQEAENITKEMASKNFESKRLRQTEAVKATAAERAKKLRLKVAKIDPGKFGKNRYSQTLTNMKEELPQPDYRNILKEAAKWNRRGGPPDAYGRSAYNAHW